MSSPARLAWVLVHAAVLAVGGVVGYRIAGGGSWDGAAVVAFFSFVVTCAVDLLSHRGGDVAGLDAIDEGA